MTRGVGGVRQLIVGLGVSEGGRGYDRYSIFLIRVSRIIKEAASEGGGTNPRGSRHGG